MGATVIDLDDGPLVRRVLDGDDAAFGDLVERYMRRAYYSALGLTGSTADAQDLSQEAFARAFRARKKLDPERPFFAWLYQILRRLCFNHNRDRRSRRDKLASQTAWLVADRKAAQARKAPAMTLEREETRKRVMESIGTLGEREREILVLREFEGLKYREIADLIGIPIGTVMSRLYTARRHLADRLEDLL
jgi:RNA polymerase sigma-70 factor (ECF subfamily)